MVGLVVGLVVGLGLVYRYIIYKHTHTLTILSIKTEREIERGVYIPTPSHIDTTTFTFSLLRAIIIILLGKDEGERLHISCIHAKPKPSVTPVMSMTEFIE